LTFFKTWSETRLLEYVAWLCYRRLVNDEEITWDDLANLYEQETERLMGISGYLTEREGHQLVGILDSIIREERPSTLKHQSLMTNLRRSLPQTWVETAGSGMFGNIGAVTHLLCLTVLAIGPNNPRITPSGAVVVLVTVAVITLCFSVPTVFTVRASLGCTKALHAIKKGLTQ
jgi:hypothetical protein